MSERSHRKPRSIVPASKSASVSGKTVEGSRGELWNKNSLLTHSHPELAVRIQTYVLRIPTDDTLKFAVTYKTTHPDEELKAAEEAKNCFNSFSEGSESFQGSTLYGAISTGQGIYRALDKLVKKDTVLATQEAGISGLKFASMTPVPRSMAFNETYQGSDCVIIDAVDGSLTRLDNSGRVRESGKWTHESYNESKKAKQTTSVKEYIQALTEGVQGEEEVWYDRNPEDQEVVANRPNQLAFGHSASQKSYRKFLKNENPIP